MAGGMSHLDTLDPKAGVEAAGPVRSIAASADGVQLSEYLPRLAKQMHLGTVVRSMSSTQGAHEQGNYFMHTSYKLRRHDPPPGDGGVAGRAAGRRQPDAAEQRLHRQRQPPPRCRLLPRQARAAVRQQPGERPAERRPPERAERGPAGRPAEAGRRVGRRLPPGAFPTADVNAYADAYDGALALMKSKDLAAFDLTQEPEAVRKAYGPDAFGQGCLLARRLAERGVRYVEVSINGWDTHSANFVRTPELAEVLDKALSSLLADLSALGMLKDTLVVLATEFGRTPVINANVGRDHYPQAFSCALFGGGMKAGYVHGKTTKDGSEVDGDRVKIPDLNATIAAALGLPLDRVVQSPTQRPFTVADKGKPVDGAVRLNASRRSVIEGIPVTSPTRIVFDPGCLPVRPRPCVRRRRRAGRAPGGRRRSSRRGSRCAATRCPTGSATRSSASSSTGGRRRWPARTRSADGSKTRNWKELAADFKGERFDPDHWADVFQKAGAKYVVQVAEHHDALRALRLDAARPGRR